MTTTKIDVSVSESEATVDRTIEHSFKRGVEIITFVLLVPWVIFIAWYAHSYLPPQPSSDMSAELTQWLGIAFMASISIFFGLIRNRMFNSATRTFRTLRKVWGRDSKNHRRFFKAMMFQSETATTGQSLLLWTLFLIIHLSIAAMGGFSLGWAILGGITSTIVLGATVAVNSMIYGLFYAYRLHREQKAKDDPYHGQFA